MPHCTPEQREIEQLKLELWKKTIELDCLRDNAQKLREVLTFLLGLDKLSDQIRDMNLLIKNDIPDNSLTKIK